MHNVACCASPQLTQVLEHYLLCKSTSDSGTTAWVLIYKDHQSFASMRLPLLRNMQELSCACPIMHFGMTFTVPFMRSYLHNKVS